MERLVKLDDRTYEVAPGADFGKAVAELKQIVTQSGATATLRSNGGVECYVNARSNPRVFLEAHLRATACKGPTIFGPELLELSPEQQLSDASLDTRRPGSEAKWVAVWNEIEVHKGTFEVAPGQRGTWNEYVQAGLLNRTRNEFDRPTVAAAWRVGCLAQAMMNAGHSLPQCWHHALSRANFEDVDPTYIVKLLKETWKHRRRLNEIYP